MTVQQVKGLPCKRRDLCSTESTKGKRRELIPQSCPLTSAGTQWLTRQPLPIVHNTYTSGDNKLSF